MNKLTALTAGILLGLALTACGGGGGSPQGNGGLSPLTFDIVTNPGSSVASAQVTGKYASMADPAFAWIAGKLPAGSTPIAGMILGPATPQGGGFSGILSAKLDDAKGTSQVVSSAVVNVYLCDMKDQSMKDYAVVETGPDGSFNLPLDFLGALVFATSPHGANFSLAGFADQASTGVGTSINFHAQSTGGVDPIAYSWDFGDTHSATGATVAHAYLAPGSYNVLLRATDALGNIAPAVSTPIDISSTAPPLTGVVVAVTPGAANSGAFSFVATATGGTAPLSFFWDFAGAGSGPDTATTPTGITTHTFATPGLYTGTCKVTDALGVSVTSAPFTCDARPTPVITALSTTEGAIGDKLTLTGNHFGTQGATDAVQLGGVTMTLDPAGAWTDTQIDVLVPAGSTNGNIIVHKLLDSNGMPFKVIPATPGGPGGGQF